MEPEDLYRAQAVLEGLRSDDDGRLERWKDMPGESGPPPRVVAVDYGHRQIAYFGSGIDRATEEGIRRLPVRVLLEGDPVALELLGGPWKVEPPAEFLTYTMLDAGTLPPGPDVVRLSRRDELLNGFGDGSFGTAYDVVFAVIQGAAIVSAAASVREDETSAEVWVRTLPEHRRRGYATQAVAAWFRSVAGRGLIPFYSHASQNDASRRLAQSLGLRLCFVLSCYS
jgi:RimJ/RimL family protein N-acetyltransferase